MQTRMTALFRRAAAGELTFGEKGRKAMAIALKKKFAKQRYRTDVCAMRPAISVLSFSVFSGCLNVSKHQKTISGFRPQNRKHPQLPKEWPKPERESNGIRPQNRAHPQSSKNDPAPKSNFPAQAPVFAYRYRKDDMLRGPAPGKGLVGVAWRGSLSSRGAPSKVFPYNEFLSSAPEAVACGIAACRAGSTSPSGAAAPDGFPARESPHARAG